MSLIFDYPYEGELLIKSGQTVDFETPLLKQFSKKEIKVPLAQMLGTSPKKIFQLLKKFVGEEVKKGELIAQNSSFLTQKKYFSEYDGVIKEVNHQEGVIVVEINTDKETTVKSFFKGEVQELVYKTEGSETAQKGVVTIKLKVKHSVNFELKECSEDFGGSVCYCTDPHKAQLTCDDVSDKIVVDKDIPAYEQVKYEALGLKGFITLHSLKEKSSTPLALLAQIPDYEAIEKNTLPFCMVIKNENKVYFYE